MRTPKACSFECRSCALTVCYAKLESYGEERAASVEIEARKQMILVPCLN